MRGELAEKIIPPTLLLHETNEADWDVVADVALFILSHRARFMTGCILPVGGSAELDHRR